MQGAYCSKRGERTVLNAGSAVLNAGSDTVQKRLSFLAYCSRKKQLSGLEIIFMFEKKD